MKIEVLLSSGETDRWTGADDAVVDHGALHVLEKLENQPLEGLKLTHIHTQEDQGSDLPPADISTAYLLRAVYAPGMWMKVVYLP